MKVQGAGRWLGGGAGGSRGAGGERLPEYGRPGDPAVVTELSQMTRSSLDLLQTSTVLERRHVSLVSPRENIDTTTATGRYFLAMMATIRQMERALHGACGGRPLPPGIWRCRIGPAMGGEHVGRSHRKAGGARISRHAAAAGSSARRCLC